MAIRLANNCSNCTNLAAGEQCTVHEVEVSAKHTCDSFDMQGALKDKMECSTCARYETSTCAHPGKASPEMLCTHWAPRAVA